MSQTKAQLIDPVDGTIVNADINASAAIAGSKISPDFGSQNIVTTGSVGIGIGSQTPSTPQKQLHIAHDSSPRIMLSNDTTGHATPNGTELLLDSNGNFEILQRENLNVEFFTNGSQRMTINGSGNVGIGTTTPATALDCTGTIHASTSIGIRTTSPQCNLHVHQGDSGSVFAKFTNSTTTIGSSNGFDVGLNSSEQGFLHVRENKPLLFQINGSERARIDTSGNVGIGTTSPSTNLHVHTDANGEGILVKSTGNTSNALTFDANRGTGGVIGVAYGRWNGTTVAQMSFVSGSDGTNKDDGFITFGTESAASSGNVNATERMRIDSSGNVGIGVSPTAKLHVYKANHYVVTDSGKATHGIHVRGSNGNAGEYGGAISFSCGDGDSSAAIAARQGGSDADFTGMSFFTHPSGTSTDDAVEKVRIHHSGEASFNDGICLGNGLTLSSSNTMEDYEEGTFTPSLVQGYNNITYTVQAGFYTKVGRFVSYSIYLYVATAGGDNAEIRISLPFTTVNTQYLEEGAFIVYDSNFLSSSNDEKSNCYILSGRNYSYLRLFKNTNGAAIFGNDTLLGTGANNVYLLIKGFLTTS